MAALPPPLRKQLEKTIVQARAVAERGARAALESLAVHHHEPHGSLTTDQRLLRKRLREHGRQLGDLRDEQGGQAIDRLTREVAYEHWHRMLFARFLAENGLLVEPDHQVAVSLEEVAELARARRLEVWSLAAQFAQRMLPQLFRVDDPALQVALPPEMRTGLERLVRELPTGLFTSDDALGWTYQFWQSAEKDAVNARAKSGEKITGATLPAVTQLFTEPYMVQFLLHNTLGAWHAAKVLAQRPELAVTAKDEAELRAAVALPGQPFDYLRFVRDGDDSPWRPAAGNFATWPHAARELKVLDPCCGSGHFLVAAFELLAALRRHEESLSVADAATAVLRENLFGLELDARCTQIAAFALALAAWKRIGAGHGVAPELPPLQIACCGIGPAGTKKQWLELAEKATPPLSGPVRNALAALYDLFQQAPDLGSLIDPRQITGQLLQADFPSIVPLFEKVLQSEAADEAEREQAVAAQGMAKAAALLGQCFTLVVTNVPYLGRGSHGDVLKEFAERRWPEAKADLATLFVQRSFGWLGNTGTAAVVTPQNWLFLTSYRKLRERLLNERTWNFVSRLGPRAFETIGGHVVNAALIEISACPPNEDTVLAGIDVSGAATPVAKAALLRGESVVVTGVDEASATDADVVEAVADGEGEDDARADRLVNVEVVADAVVVEGDAEASADSCAKLVPQAEQLKNPDARIALESHGAMSRLELFAGGFHGQGTRDSSRFMQQWWEIAKLDSGHVYLQTTAGSTIPFGGAELCLKWENGSGALARNIEAYAREGSLSPDWDAGLQCWGRLGVLVGQTGDLQVATYLGHAFDSNCAVIQPTKSQRDGSDLPAIWCFCSSPDFAKAVRRIDQALKVTNASLVKVPFDLTHWQRIAAEQYPHGLPEPQSNDPTQWLFHGHPAGMLAAGPASASPFALEDPLGHERHASLICRTPNAADVLQVAVARLLGYRWPAELDPKMRLDVAQRAWVERCADLTAFADEDGIVCLAPTRGERSAADRLRELLEKALGLAWSTTTERRLLDAAGAAPGATLEEWLRDDFFAAHCQLFHERPFVVHLWDGRKDGFHALVHYHRLAGPNGDGRRTLELLTFTYLNDWIERQRADVQSTADGGDSSGEGADGRLEAALRLQDELKKILAGEPPYDLFIRWKPLHQQPLGWEPDMDDGARLNLRPFLLAADMKTKGAGLLRTKVALKWTKDRGKEPESLRPRDTFPWFWNCNPADPAHQRDYLAPKPAPFDGIRWNDLHYSRAVKEAARNAHSKERQETERA